VALGEIVKRKSGIADVLAKEMARSKGKLRGAAFLDDAKGGYL
jgi:hypothetical protein